MAYKFGQLHLLSIHQHPRVSSACTLACLVTHRTHTKYQCNIKRVLFYSHKLQYFNGNSPLAEGVGDTKTTHCASEKSGKAPESLSGSSCRTTKLFLASCRPQRTCSTVPRAYSTMRGNPNSIFQLGILKLYIKTELSDANMVSPHFKL